MTASGFLIIGSGPAAVSAATAYREAGGTDPVRLISADQDLPYDRPPLSKDALRADADLDDVYLHAQTFYPEHGIDVRLDTTVRALDVGAHEVVLADGARFGYRSCLVATGSRPVRPSLPGVDGAHVHVLRSRRDGVALQAAAAAGDHAVVAGSGFIGCEAAAALAQRGLGVTLVTAEPEPHRQRLGEHVSARVAGWLRDAGGALITGDELAEVTDAGVRTASGRTIDGGLVLLATGVRPCSELAREAGLTLEQGRIPVDASMRTVADGILAAGDVVYAHNLAAGRAITVEHWGDALTMGEIAGRTAAGRAAEWGSAPGFWSSIGEHTLKYSAWGDGYDDVRVEEHGNEAFTVWYGRDGRVVGVLTHEADDDYERGQELVEQGAPGPFG